MRALVVAVAASAARTAKAKGGWGTGVTTAPHHQGLAAAAAVVLVAHGAEGAGVAALTGAVECACAEEALEWAFANSTKLTAIIPKMTPD